MNKLRWVLANLKWGVSHHSYELIEKNLPASGRILDIGSGYGLLVNFIGQKKDRQVVGVDKSFKKIDFASQKKLRNVQFIYGDAQKMKMKNFKAIIMSDFLHHLSLAIQDKLILQAFGQLKKGGILLIKEVQGNFYNPAFLAIFCFDKLINFFSPLYFRSKKDYQRKLKQIGFKIKKSQKVPGSLWGEYLLIAKKE